METDITIGGCRLICGDCLDVLPTLAPGSVDAVVTDPPFGVGNFIQISGNLRGKEVKWNDTPPPPVVFEHLRSISKHRIIWGANYFNCFEKNGGAIVWLKDQNCPNFSKCDIASCSHLKKVELVRIPWNGFVGSTKESDHPCERPVSLYVWCIKYLPYSETVLDPFMGSGTTGVACVQTGRRFIGVEKDRRYFEIAVNRIRKAVEDVEREGLFLSGGEKAEQPKLFEGVA